MKLPRRYRLADRHRALVLAAALTTGGCGLLAGLGDEPVVPPDGPADSGSPDGRADDATVDAVKERDGSLPDGDAMADVQIDGDGGETGVLTATGGHIASVREMVYVTRSSGTSSWGSFDDDRVLRALHRRDPDASTRSPAFVVGEDGGVLHADEVSGKLFHVCAREQDHVYCWGTDLFRLLGGSLRAPSTTRVLVPGGVPLDGVLQIAAGGFFSCARRASDVMCWGGAENGAFAELARLDAASETEDYAVAIPGIGATRTIAVGHHHACAVLEPDGRVVCWGRNDLGQSGTEADAGPSCPSGPCLSPPAPVAGLRDVRQLALAGHHSCALTGAGEVWCWGGDVDHCLGPAIVTRLCNGTEPQAGPFTAPCTATPQRVTQLPPADSIAVGEEVSCAVAGGKVYCWGGGNASFGQGPSGPDKVATPLAVRTAQGELTGMREVSTDFASACAIGTNEEVYCWGAGPLGLGDGGDFREHATRVTF